MTTQAESIIAKFGNARRLAKLLGVHPSTVNRWNYARADRGTGGLIPSSALKRVLALAAARGIVITATDLYPSA